MSRGKGSTARAANRADERSLESLQVRANLTKVPLTDATIYCEDNISGMPARIAPGSVDLVITSIPFGALFMYSGKTEDIGNNLDSGGALGVDMRASQFGLHLRFHIEQLYKTMADGAVACVHVQQLLTTKVQHGYMGRRDFRGAVVDLYSAGGFNWTGEMVIPKNPQRVAQAQSIHSLLFITGLRDSRDWAPYVNDYVLIFRKPGKGKPVRALYRADENPAGWVTSEEWIRDAHGLWVDIQETDVLGGYKHAGDEDDEKHVCLGRGSLVLTRDGHKPVENVEVGDLVLTHRGRWRPVTAKRCNGFRQVVETRAHGVPGLRTTPDHELYVRRGVGTGGGRWKSGGTSHPRTSAMLNQPEWVRADATKGHYVNLKLPPIEESDYSVHEWWLIGRWLGDGHFDTRGRLHISCSHEEAPLLSARLGGWAGPATVRRTATQISIRDKEGRLRRLLAKCGRGAAGKRLPAEALALNPRLAEALLSGYLSADGSYIPQYQRWTASSVSRPLLLGMAMVAQRARGVVASIFAARPGGTYVIEGRVVATLDEWVMSIPTRNLSGLMLDDGAWKKVRSVQPVGEAEVWDLRVEEDESFTAEGCIVHNCPLQLEVVRRCMKLYSNPGDLVMDPFLGIGSVAYVAIELGRNAVGFELKESYYQQALKHVRLAREARHHPPTTDLFSALEPTAEEFSDGISAIKSIKADAVASLWPRVGRGGVGRMNHSA